MGMTVFNSDSFQIAKMRIHSMFYICSLNTKNARICLKKVNLY